MKKIALFLLFLSTFFLSACNNTNELKTEIPASHAVNNSLEFQKPRLKSNAPNYLELDFKKSVLTDGILIESDGFVSAYGAEYVFGFFGTAIDQPLSDPNAPHYTYNAADIYSAVSYFVPYESKFHRTPDLKAFYLKQNDFYFKAYRRENGKIRELDQPTFNFQTFYTVLDLDITIPLVEFNGYKDFTYYTNSDFQDEIYTFRDLDRYSSKIASEPVVYALSVADGDAPILEDFSYLPLFSYFEITEPLNNYVLSRDFYKIDSLVDPTYTFLATEHYFAYYGNDNLYVYLKCRLRLVDPDLNRYVVPKLVNHIDFSGSIDHSILTPDSNISGLFLRSEAFDIDIRGLNLEGLSDLSHLFSGCKKLKVIKGLEELDTSNVVDFSYFFYETRSLEEANLENFDLSGAKYLAHMFDKSRDHLIPPFLFKNAKPCDVKYLFANLSNIDLEPSSLNLTETYDARSLFYQDMFVNGFTFDHGDYTSLKYIDLMFDINGNYDLVVDHAVFDPDLSFANFSGPLPQFGHVDVTFSNNKLSDIKNLYSFFLHQSFSGPNFVIQNLEIDISPRSLGPYFFSGLFFVEEVMMVEHEPSSLVIDGINITCKDADFSEVFLDFVNDYCDFDFTSLSNWQGTNNISSLAHFIKLNQAYNVDNNFVFDLSSWDLSNCTSFAFVFDRFMLSNWDATLNLANTNINPNADFTGAFNNTNFRSFNLANSAYSNIANLYYHLVNNSNYRNLIDLNLGDFLMDQNTSDVYGRDVFAQLFRHNKNNKLNINSFQTASTLTDISYFFANLNTSEFDFTLLSNLNTTSIENFAYLFANVTTTSDPMPFNFSAWDFSSAVNLDHFCNNNTLFFDVDLHALDLSKVTNLDHVFANMPNLRSVNFNHVRLPKFKELPDGNYGGDFFLNLPRVRSFNFSNTYYSEVYPLLANIRIGYEDIVDPEIYLEYFTLDDDPYYDEESGRGFYSKLLTRNASVYDTGFMITKDNCIFDYFFAHLSRDLLNTSTYLSWDVSKVSSYRSCFAYFNRFTTIPYTFHLDWAFQENLNFDNFLSNSGVTGIEFPLNRAKPLNVKSAVNFCTDCRQLEEINLELFDFSNANNFFKDSFLSPLTDAKFYSLNTASLASFGEQIHLNNNASKLVSFTVTNGVSDQVDDIGNYSFKRLFSEAFNLKTLSFELKTNLVNSFIEMFYETGRNVTASSISYDLSNWQLSYSSGLDLTSMFSHFSNLGLLTADNWQLGDVISADFMFAGARTFDPSTKRQDFSFSTWRPLNPSKQFIELTPGKYTRMFIECNFTVSPHLLEHVTFDFSNFRFLEPSTTDITENNIRFGKFTYRNALYSEFNFFSNALASLASPEQLIAHFDVSGLTFDVKDVNTRLFASVLNSVPLTNNFLFSDLKSSYPGGTKFFSLFAGANKNPGFLGVGGEGATSYERLYYNANFAGDITMPDQTDHPYSLNYAFARANLSPYNKSTIQINFPSTALVKSLDHAFYKTRVNSALYISGFNSDYLTNMSSLFLEFESVSDDSNPNLNDHSLTLDGFTFDNAFSTLYAFQFTSDSLSYVAKLEFLKTTLISFKQVRQDLINVSYKALTSLDLSGLVFENTGSSAPQEYLLSGFSASLAVTINNPTLNDGITYLDYIFAVRMYEEFPNISSTDLSAWRFKVASLAFAFASNTYISDIDLSYLDVSNCSSFESMFASSSLTTFISRFWHILHANNIRRMFYNTKSFTTWEFGSEFYNGSALYFNDTFTLSTYSGLKPANWPV